MRPAEAFGVLGLASDTPLKEVRRTYHGLIKRLHPDASGRDSEQIVRVIEAYHSIRKTDAKSGPFDARETIDPRTVFSLGRWATQASDRRVRLHAVRRLSASRLQSAAVFLRNAMNDSDREIASSAAEGFLFCAGVNAEQTLLDTFETMPVVNRIILLAAIASSGRYMPRVLAYAAADPVSRVRDAAERIINTSGGRTE